MTHTKTLSLIAAIVAAALSVSALSPEARADVLSVPGTNPQCASTGGSIYIPYTPGASGVLGVNGVGLSRDAAHLNGVPTSSGYVQMMCRYDWSQSGLQLIPPTVSLSYTFGDLDFLPDAIGDGTLVEHLTLAFTRDADVMPGSGAPTLALNGGNYMAYRTSPAGTATDDTTASYVVNMLAELGVTQADFDAINADREFGVLMTLSATVTKTGSEPTTIYNTQEDVCCGLLTGNALVPEPASGVLLAAGLGGILFRRRRQV